MNKRSAERSTRRLGVGALLAVSFALTSIWSCSAGDNPAVGGGGAGPGAIPPVGPCSDPGCPCDGEGTWHKCGKVIGRVGTSISCVEGRALCENGSLGECETGEGLTTQFYGFDTKPGGLSLAAFGAPTTCNSNPCDPYCQSFDDSPDPGMSSTEGGIVATEGGISLIPKPPGDAGAWDGAGPPPTCGSSTQQAQLLPLDMFLMLDRSGSMGTSNRWGKVRDALTAFVSDPQSAGMGIGQGFFYPQKKPNNSGSISTCKASDYAKPSVPIADLPGNRNAIVNDLNGIRVGGGTPTLPALEGAIDYARAWQIANPQRKAVVVLATDGEPNGCSSTISRIEQAARDGLNGTPSITTFVIGVGKSLTNLNRIAAAGGTGQAILVDSSSFTTQQFVDAMNDIRGQSLSCNFKVPTPPAGTLDPDTLEIRFSPSVGKPVSMMKVADLTKCGSSTVSWYADNPSNPNVMTLCPETCKVVRADTSGRIDVVYQCYAEYAPGEFTRDFDGRVACPASGTVPVWGAWSWDSETKLDSHIDFSLQASDDAAQLGAAPEDALQFTDPPGPTSLLGQPIGAKAGPPDTQVGATIVQNTLMSNGRGTKRFLRMRVKLAPSSNKIRSPLLKSWNLQVSCQQSE